jgi:hypothetical protein
VQEKLTKLWIDRCLRELKLRPEKAATMTVSAKG